MTTAGFNLLTAAQRCLDSARLVSNLRLIVREHVSEYEQCVDQSLSQQLELLGALMNEYMMSCEKEEEYEAKEVGEEPLSYSDAIRLVDAFIDVAIDEVNGALKSSKFLFRAMEISVRATTFAFRLGWKEEATAGEKPK